MSADAAIAGLILAGGQARRMGGCDKALLQLAGRSLLAHVAERLRPQVSGLLISANGDPGRFAMSEVPVIADAEAGFPGPLAGILAGMDYLAANIPAAAFLLSVPTDCPFLPVDLASRLTVERQRAGADVAFAASGGRDHPVIALWSLALREELRAALARQERAVMAFVARLPHARVLWPVEPADPFANINTPEQLAEAEARIAAT